MSVLSIQSHVSFGHAGNSSAVFPLQTLGHEVWPIHTVQFSNHTGYGKWGGDVFSAKSIQDIAEGIFEVTSYNDCRAILTGYMGDQAIGSSIKDIITRIKKENPEALYFCDPVMGDRGRGFYVREGIPEYFKKHIIPLADHISPNHFEFEFLTDSKVGSYKDIARESKKIFEQGVSSILLTSFVGPETPTNSIEVILIRPNSIYKIVTPFLESTHDKMLVGTGDLISSLFLGHVLSGEPYELALENSVSKIYGIIENTIKKNRYELDIIGSREILLNAPKLYKGVQVKSEY